MCRGHPLVGMIGLNRKSAGICICYRPTCRGFSHCPIHVGRQPQKPTLVYATIASGYISPEISCRMQDNHISTGIYRCSTLDMNMKFCENFDKSRISADKRFLMYLNAERDVSRPGDPPCISPDRGLCISVCICKTTNYF